RTAQYHRLAHQPEPYPGHTPHIHFSVKNGYKRLLTTQIYVKREPGNEKDGICMSIKDQKVRDSITVDFVPLKGSRTGEVVARFDIIVGLTPNVEDKD